MTVQKSGSVGRNFEGGRLEFMTELPPATPFDLSVECSRSFDDIQRRDLGRRPRQAFGEPGASFGVREDKIVLLAVDGQFCGKSPIYTFGIDDERGALAGAARGHINVVTIVGRIDVDNGPVDGPALGCVNGCSIGPAKTRPALRIRKSRWIEGDPPPIDIRFDPGSRARAGQAPPFADLKDSGDGAIDDAQFVVADEKADKVATGEANVRGMAGGRCRLERDLLAGDQPCGFASFPHLAGDGGNGGIGLGKDQDRPGLLLRMRPGGFVDHLSDGGFGAFRFDQEPAVGEGFERGSRQLLPLPVARCSLAQTIDWRACSR